MLKVNAAPLWKYIKERELIRLSKADSDPRPWTSDPIFQKFKFTNVRRLHDRTTQHFLEVYREHRRYPPEVALYNCAVRRFFGTMEFSDSVGWLGSHSLPLLRKAVAKCPKPWTGAYMIRAGASGIPKVDVVALYLRSLWVKAKEITEAIERNRSWASGYVIMRDCYGFGPFMAKEVLQDYLLWRDAASLPNVDDAETFTPIGPGGRRGLNRLAGRDLHAHPSESAMLEEVRALVKAIQPKWIAESFEGRLSAHDIQFCLCEFDKYERVRLGQGRPRSTYKRKEQES